jgi:hypothetical protein
MQRKIFRPLDWMAWELSLEAFGFMRGSSHSSNTPNAKTLEAIRQAENGENLVEVDNIEDLFQKIGI